MAILDTGPGIASPGPALTLETDSGGLSRQTKSPEHSMHPGLPDSKRVLEWQSQNLWLLLPQYPQTPTANLCPSNLLLAEPLAEGDT